MTGARPGRPQGTPLQGGQLLGWIPAFAGMTGTGRPQLALDSGFRGNDGGLGAMNHAATKNLPLSAYGPPLRRPLHNPRMECERDNAPLLANLGGPVFGFPLSRE